VAEAFLDHLQVCAAMEEPGGVRVPKMLGLVSCLYLGGRHGRLPHVLAEPVARDVPIGVDKPGTPRSILAPLGGQVAGGWLAT
jgi:hypothetical protein